MLAIERLRERGDQLLKVPSASPSTANTVTIAAIVPITATIRCAARRLDRTARSAWHHAPLRHAPASPRHRTRQRRSSASRRSTRPPDCCKPDGADRANPRHHCERQIGRPARARQASRTASVALRKLDLIPRCVHCHALLPPDEPRQHVDREPRQPAHDRAVMRMNCRSLPIASSTRSDVSSGSQDVTVCAMSSATSP